MANTKFDAKSFNPEAFGLYIENVPNLRRNELIKSRALKGNPEIKKMFSNQTGTYYGRVPMLGNLGGDPVNYDGSTNITSSSTTTFEKGVVVFGRAKAWTERDFSYDITSGVDFMSNVARQVSEYWEQIDQNILLSILKGIFAMTGANNLKFVNGHTLDVTSETGTDSQGNPNNFVGSTTLNKAIQKASGANKGKFTLVIMHSEIATNLENLSLLKYLTYTDSNGIQRDLSLASWNGRSVLIDDSMPTEDIDPEYTLTSDVAIDSSKTYYTRSGSSGNYSYTKVASPDVTDIATYYEMTAEGYTKYTTYILGDGAFDYENIGAKVPYEMDRDPKTNGGQDTLYTRQRKVLSPMGISFEIPNGMGLSPTNANFEDGNNWTLVHDAGVGAARVYFDHKAIPIARIISRG